MKKGTKFPILLPCESQVGLSCHKCSPTVEWTSGTSPNMETITKSSPDDNPLFIDARKIPRPTCPTEPQIAFKTYIMNYPEFRYGGVVDLI